MAIKSEASTNTTVRPARAISAKGVFVVVVTALLGLQMMLAEYLAPLWPERYRDVAMERRELRGSVAEMC
jgi:hypothetical protein